MRGREFVVEFRMPEDDLLSFRRTNVPAGNKAEAVSRLKAALPNIGVCGCHEGMVCLYGQEYSLVQLEA